MLRLILLSDNKLDTAFFETAPYRVGHSFVGNYEIDFIYIGDFTETPPHKLRRVGEYDNFLSGPHHNFVELSLTDICCGYAIIRIDAVDA